jgi:hypothetical protein
MKKRKVFGEVDLWDYIDKEALKDALEIGDKDWENYDIVFQVLSKEGSAYANIVGYL